MLWRGLESFCFDRIQVAKLQSSTCSYPLQVSIGKKKTSKPAVALREPSGAGFGERMYQSCFGINSPSFHSYPTASLSIIAGVGKSKLQELGQCDSNKCCTCCYAFLMDPKCAYACILRREFWIVAEEDTLQEHNLDE